VSSTLIADISWIAVPWTERCDTHVQEAWDYLASIDTAATVFNHRQWLEIACSTRAIRPWGVIIIRRGNQVIGLFPVQRITLWKWSLITYFSQGNPQILLDPTHAQEAWCGLFRWFRSLRGVAMISLGLCSHAQSVQYIKSASALSDMQAFIIPSRLPCVWTDLPESWETFYRSLSSSARKELHRAERRLMHDYPSMRIEHMTDPESCAAAVDELIFLYRQRWGNRIGGCSFTRLCNATFYRKAVLWAVQHGYATVSRLRIIEQTIVVGTLFHLPGQDTLYEQFVGRNPDALANRYSPGIVEYITTFRWAIKQGYRRVNQGLGAARYKITYGGREEPVWEIGVTRSRLGAVLLPVVDRIAYLIQRLPTHLCYYITHIYT